jgi:molybdopterin converting factor small subunit
MVRIGFTTLFSDRVGGASSVEVDAPTVASALRAMTDRHPELAPLVWKSDGALNPVMVLFLNDRQLAPGALATPLQSGDRLDIIPSIEGGSTFEGSTVLAGC